MSARISRGHDLAEVRSGQQQVTTWQRSAQVSRGHDLAEVSSGQREEVSGRSIGQGDIGRGRQACVLFSWIKVTGPAPG